MAELMTSRFRAAAVRSGLVTTDALRRAVAELQASHRTGPVSDDQLAARLVQLGFLTAYQADQLKAGRTKFTLGPYLITDWIGQGGMGQVFKAVHEVMGRETAVKVLPLERATPQAIENFLREIRTQAKLDHPNLVRAYDAGQDGNVHYLATEYVPGMDLRRLVRSRGPLTMRQAASVVRQAALGLEYAHQRGLIHRDVKPGNVLVTPDGRAKVSDLGLAGVLPEADQDDPRLGKIVGTVDYLSPEQIKTPQFVEAVSDLYSLGCTLYYAVTGKVPFPGGTTQDKVRRHCEATPWHPRRFNSGLSEEFVDIIADMMEKDPRRRIQTAAEVAARLEPWAGEPHPLGATTDAARWLPPPVPTGADTQETTAAASDSGARGGLSGSDPPGPHATAPIDGASQETIPARRLWRPASAAGFAPGQLSYGAALLVVAAATLLSLAVGVLIGFLLHAAL